MFIKRAVVAEWLRRLTRNQIPSGSVGSNPTDCEKYLFWVDLIFPPKMTIGFNAALG